jgi:Domain of unknown function (DUF6378)
MTANRTLASRLLEQAADVVGGGRRQQNGPPERSLACIGDFWEVYLRHRSACLVNGSRNPIDAADVATLMELLKIGRSLYGEPIDDHFIDRAGYAALAGEAELLATREGITEQAVAEPQSTDPTADPVLQEVAAELERARAKFPPMRSAHEGWAILAEEFDELTTQVRRKQPDPARMRAEAVQVCAMAVRLIVDVIDQQD